MTWLILGVYAAVSVVAAISYIVFGLVSRRKTGSADALESMREFDKSVTDRRSERDPGSGAATSEAGGHFRWLWNPRH